jgi:dTDP-glucose pyrophosphorylase/CBS domain-containing protein
LTDKEKRLDRLILPEETSLGEALHALDVGGVGILLICSGNRKLLGIVTDGDIRRGLLSGMTLADPSLTVATREPLVAPQGTPGSEAEYLMDQALGFVVDHLPVVDEAGRVVDLFLRHELFDRERLPLSAVVMAGGKGIRLRPLTEKLPKPMLPIGKKPLLELLVHQLRRSGIRKVKVATHFEPERITEHFQDGSGFGVEIDYLQEEEPLGTAGALGMLPPQDDPLLVINGDILTNINFARMLDFHNQHKADMTIGVRDYRVRVPYGVIECNGPDVMGVTEKPVQTFLVNAGIYVISPAAQQRIPQEHRYDMTDLVENLLADSKRVISFPIVEYWLDIGRPDDYLRGQTDVENGVLDDVVRD